MNGKNWLVTCVALCCVGGAAIWIFFPQVFVPVLTTVRAIENSAAAVLIGSGVACFALRKVPAGADAVVNGVIAFLLTRAALNFAEGFAYHADWPSLVHILLPVFPLAAFGLWQMYRNLPMRMKVWRSAGQSKQVLLPSISLERDGYKIYTTRYDLTLASSELDRLLPPKTSEEAKAHKEAYQAFNIGLLGWKTTARIKALEVGDRLRTQPNLDLSTVAVTLLVDQSGSMRGAPVLMATAAVSITAELLTALQIQHEVLGFTTRSWRGGQSREDWIRAGKPPHPGRLCDVLHIIYDDKNWPKHMLREDLLKENIDGEAIEWAAGRLMSRQQNRKILVHLSDGAPVDDSTIDANGEKYSIYLSDHLHRAIKEASAQGIEMAAVGIAYDVRRFYPAPLKAATIQFPADLGGTLLSLLESILSEPADSAAANPETRC